MGFMTGGVKGSKSEKPKKKTREKDDDDDSVPYEQMTEDQKRNFEVQIF
jgi:hypothetical protein